MAQNAAAPTSAGFGVAQTNAKPPNMYTNPFDKKINLLAQEDILVCKARTKMDSTAEQINLTIENGDKFLANMKSKSSEYYLNHYIQIPMTGNGMPLNTHQDQQASHNFSDYKKRLESCHDITLEQVQAFTCYNWGNNNIHHIKMNDFIASPLDFLVAEPKLI